MEMGQFGSVAPLEQIRSNLRIYLPLVAEPVADIESFCNYWGTLLAADASNEGHALGCFELLEGFDG